MLIMLSSSLASLDEDCNLDVMLVGLMIGFFINDVVSE